MNLTIKCTLLVLTTMIAGLSTPAMASSTVLRRDGMDRPAPIPTPTPRPMGGGR